MVRNKFFIFLILMAIQISAQKAAAKNSIVLDKEWVTKCVPPTFSIRYNKCWIPREPATDLTCEQVKASLEGGLERPHVTPTENCPKNLGGNWDIYFVRPKDQEISQKMSPDKPEIFQTSLENDGHKITFHHVGDLQYSYWYASMKCSYNFAFEFRENTKQAQTKEHFDQHQIPEIFKAFMLGVKCKHSKK